MQCGRARADLPRPQGRASDAGWPAAGQSVHKSFLMSHVHQRANSWVGRLHLALMHCRIMHSSVLKDYCEWPHWIVIVFYPLETKKNFKNESPLQPHLQIAASPLFFLIKRGWRRADFTLPLCPFQIDSDIALSCPLVPSLILSSATCPVEQPCQCSSATSLWCSWSASRVKLDLSPKIPNSISYIRQLFAI